MLSMHSYGNRDNTIDSINCKRIHFSGHFSLEFYYNVNSQAWRGERSSSLGTSTILEETEIQLLTSIGSFIRR